MEVIKLVLAGLGCLGLLIVGSCTMLGMAGAQMVNKAVELEKVKQAERSASSGGADSSRFGASSRYEYRSSSSSQKPTPMDDPDWKFGDPTTEVK
jgi:hypothetical protein